MASTVLFFLKTILSRKRHDIFSTIIVNLQAQAGLKRMWPTRRAQLSLTGLRPYGENSAEVLSSSVKSDTYLGAKVSRTINHQFTTHA